MRVWAERHQRSHRCPQDSSMHLVSSAGRVSVYHSVQTAHWQKTNRLARGRGAPMDSAHVLRGDSAALGTVRPRPATDSRKPRSKLPILLSKRSARRVSFTACIKANCTKAPTFSLCFELMRATCAVALKLRLLAPRQIPC